jgi:tetratricopeptide (TPR) repeat protein
MIPMQDPTFAALIRIALDSHIARSLWMLAACLLLCQSLGLAATDHAKTRFAVIPRRIAGDPDLGTAIAFDLEKRLERWPCMEDVERLDLQRVLRRTSSGTEKAAVAMVLENLKADVVIVISGSGKEGQLRLTVDIWKSATSPARSFAASGSLQDFFRCQDEMTASAVTALRSIYPSLPAPVESDRLGLHPAASFEAYISAIRGKCAMETGDNTGARSHLLQSLSLDPALWWSHYWLGAVEFHEGRFTEAIEQCKAALALDPDLYPPIYANLACCYAGLGDDARARYYRAEFERRTGKKLPLP